MLLPDIPDNVISDLIVACVHDPLCNCSQKDNDCHLFQDCKDSCEIHTPFSIIRSTARPVNTGRYKVNATVTAARTMDIPR